MFTGIMGTNPRCEFEEPSLETLTGDQLPPLSLSDTMSAWAAWSVQVVENSGAVRSTLLTFFPLNNILLNCLTLAVENQACWPQSCTAQVEYNTRTTQTIRLIIWLSIMNVVLQRPNTDTGELWYLPAFMRKLPECCELPQSYKAARLCDVTGQSAGHNTELTESSQTSLQMGWLAWLCITAVSSLSYGYCYLTVMAFTQA